MRQNIIQEVWAEIFDTSQSVISQIVTKFTPLIEAATDEDRPTATAVVDCDLDCVVAGRGCPLHGHIALARHAGDRGPVPGLDEQLREFHRRFSAGR